MLDKHNAHAKSFRMARDRLTDSDVDNVKLRLIATRLQFPLFFPYGEDGYRPNILHRATPDNKKRKRNRLTMREWFAYRLQSIPNEAQTLLHSRRLFQQFTVEAYTMVESERFNYIRNNQKKLRVDKYCSLQNSLDVGTSQGLNKDKRVILPSTFVGSPRYMDRLYFDVMAICSHVGFPNLFITLTCNPNWPEIHRLLAPLNLKLADRPDIISRVFKLKYEEMLSYLTKNHQRGKTVAYSKYPTSDEIDLIISVEIPSKEDDQELYALVQNHMVHGPCGIIRSESPCMKEGKSSRFYPKMFQPRTLLDANGYPVYRRRNDGRTISKNGVIIDNRHIVPYNPKLLKKYQAHVNIEWCNQSTSIKYLFKYINKGYNRVTAVMLYDGNDEIQNATNQKDEIKEYIDCRKPAIERLYFHLPGQHTVLYEDHDDIDDVLSKPSISDSKFLAWMNANKCFSEGRTLTYSEFVSKIMLTSCKGATSFEDIRTVTNIQYLTYREACFAMGFLQDDREFVEAIKEAKDWGTTNYLRKLFVLMLLIGAINKPEEIWNQTWHWLADDIAYHYSKSTINTELHIDDNHLSNLALLEIKQLLHVNKKLLKDYPSMPYPEDADCTSYLDNSLILAELNYNNDNTISEFLQLFSSMTGTGKTFIWRTLATSLRANNQIVIIVASSDIASLLLPDGRTTHSKFKISVPIYENSTCNIHQGTPMAHKFCFEVLEQSLRDIIKTKSSSNQIFGGKVIVFVIPRGSCSDIVNATINSSYLWDCCQVLRLTKNMRLQNNEQSPDEQETTAFAKWILDIGDGIIGHENDGYSTIEILEDLLITEYDDPIHAIVNSTFPDLSQHHNDTQYFISRAILASTNETVEQVNDYILSLIPDKSETIESCHFQTITTEFLNSLMTSGLPNHCVKLKIGTPIMLLRNLDQTQGMCNGTRLIITRLAKHSLPTIGLYLPKPVFSHGQLYVALSSVKIKKGLKILIHDKDQKNMTSTTNVVFKEVFNNLTSLI
uniref:ATP-dependent DNA helicase n=1 Tax=Glycine max TaxID=3847 RepID=A0A0R0HST2_SOYBN